jgi:CheY-like chemotaxis protein
MGSVRRVLVADDSAVARRLVVRQVAADGVEVVEVASARLDDAIDAATLSCALVDLDLGDGYGTDLAAELRRRSPALPVAFFTAGAPNELVAAAAKLGPVFAKPGDLDRAVEWIRTRISPA